MNYAIQVRNVRPQPVLSIRAVVPTPELIQFFDAACQEMQAYLAQLGMSQVGPPMSLWHSAPGQIPNSSDLETCLPIPHLIPASGRMSSRELPAGLEVFTVHAGAYDDMVQAFDALWHWVQAEGYEMAGPPRDVVLVGPNETSDPAAYRTEIVYPIARKQ